MERKKQNFASAILDTMGITMKEVEAELRSLAFWKAVAAECLASFLNLIIICSIYSTMHNDPDLPYSMVQVYSGVVTGLGMIAITTTSLPISGGHINPALSLAACLTGRISPCRAAVYTVVQTAGGVAGAASVLGLSGGDAAHLPQQEISKLWLEIILSFLLAMLFLSTNLKTNDNPALVIGLAYAACISSAGVIINPAASLGLSCLTGNYTNHWVGWAGPAIGATSAAICYYCATTLHTGDRSGGEGTGRKSSSNSKYKTPLKIVLAPSLPTVELPCSKNRCFSLPYQQSISPGVEGSAVKKEGKEVKVKKIKKHVHYSKGSFDEVFTDVEDQNSGSSSGYYSESFKDKSNLF